MLLTNEVMCDLEEDSSMESILVLSWLIENEIKMGTEVDMEGMFETAAELLDEELESLGFNRDNCVLKLVVS